MIDSALILVKDLISDFNIYAKEYPFVAGSFSLWFLGTMSWVLRGIPSRIYTTIMKFSTTTLTLTSTNESFYHFIKWYHKEGYASKGRYVKMSNGIYGSEETTKSVGYGTHYFWYKYRLIIMTMIKMEGVGLSKEIDEITMTTLGRSQRLFNDIFEQVKEQNDKEDKFTIKRFEESWWRTSSEQVPRKLDTIFLNEGIKEELINKLDEFLAEEQFYLDKGIPYQLGILVYGPPGTGKSSLIKGVSDYIRYKLHILNPSSLDKIESAMFRLPPKSLIAIEDIDTDISATKRKAPKPKPVEISSPNSVPEEESNVISFSFSNLSDILNAIDGVYSIHGRILIMTTNHVDKLDPALIRPGRIDLKLEIGYVDNHAIRQFFDSFYPDFNLPVNFEIRSQLSSAEVQNLILENKNNPQAVIDGVIKKQDLALVNCQGVNNG